MNKSLEELKQIVEGAPEGVNCFELSEGYQLLPPYSLLDDLLRIIKLEEENQRLRERCSGLEADLATLNGLMIEPDGVAGYHSNGNVAHWDEFDFTPASTIVATDDHQRKVKAQGIRDAVIHFHNIICSDKYKDILSINSGDVIIEFVEYAKKLEGEAS